jgi:hypothetical protein
VQPTSLVREGDGVKIWDRFYLAGTHAYPFDHGRKQGPIYNGVKAVHKFLCETHQQILAQADYTLDGHVVYESTVKESVLEEIEPDTISAFMYDKYCENENKASEPKWAAFEVALCGAQVLHSAFTSHHLKCDFPALGVLYPSVTRKIARNR